jgi:hypothetical protein
VHLEDEDRALLDAIELVIARLVVGPQVQFSVLRALEALQEEVVRELRSYAVRAPALGYAAASSASSARLRSRPPA